MNQPFISNVTNIKNKTLNDAHYLINTSVDDMQASLGCNNYSTDVLQKALEICNRRGEKTKATILVRKIKKLIKSS